MQRTTRACVYVHGDITAPELVEIVLALFGDAARVFCIPIA